MMSKVIIFSHESDIDGMGCVILAKLAFKDIDYVLAPNVEKLELIFRNYLNDGSLNNYDRIYVTDLALRNPSLTLVNDSNLKDKVLVFDHHKRAIDDGLNRYSFTKIIEEDNTGKRCATDLFYEYLCTEKLITPYLAISEFVEFTRLEDTWQWKKFSNKGEVAHDLAILFNCIGIEKYVSDMVYKLLNSEDSFSLSKEEKELIQNKKEEYNKLLEIVLSNAEYFTDENDNKFGIVFANYEYRNELAEFIVENGNKDRIKYFIVVAMDKGEFGQKSYRAIEDGFDVNEVAMLHGGGGHPGASCVSITKEQKEKSLVLSKKEGLKYLADSNYSI